MSIFCLHYDNATASSSFIGAMSSVVRTSEAAWLQPLARPLITSPRASGSGRPRAGPCITLHVLVQIL